MKRENVYLALASLLLVGGLTAFYFTVIKGSGGNSALPDASIGVIDPDFQPRHNADLSFQADVSIGFIDDSSRNVSGTILHDGKGTLRFEAKQGEDLLELYITPTQTIVCDEGGCIDFGPDSTGEVQDIFDIKSFVYDRADVQEIGEGLQRKGDVACDPFLCELWQSPAVIALSTSKVLLEKESRRIMYVEDVNDDGVVAIDFDYTDVQIILPLNVESVTPDP